VGEIAYRVLDATWVPRIAALDRRETVTAEYAVRDGAIVADERVIEVPQWSGEWLDFTLSFVQRELDDGAIFFGAMDGEDLAGLAVVGTRLRGSQQDYVQLSFLMVSQPYRRQGLATRLMELSKAVAREHGAGYLYISATPLSSAVGFYQSQGACLAREIDPGLLAMGPKDIHMEIRL